MEPLTASERLRLTWHLTWPWAVTSLLEWGVSRLTSPARASWMEMPWLLFSFFVIGPAVVRYAFSQDLGGRWLEVIRTESSGETRRWLAYRESLGISWWFAWRIIAVMILVAATAGLLFLPGAPLQRNEELETLGAILGSVFVTWWRLPDLVRERFRPQRSALP